MTPDRYVYDWWNEKEPRYNEDDDEPDMDEADREELSVAADSVDTKMVE